MSTPLPSRDWTANEIVAHLETLGSEENRLGMARFGIRNDAALGIGHTMLRPLARRVGRDHTRAHALWTSGYREARLLATLTDEPAMLTIDQCRHWAGDCDSWDIVDAASNLFARTPFWRSLVEEFAEAEPEFTRRTAFSMLAMGAVHLKAEPDATFLSYLPLIERHAGDGRNFVKKSINWALRQIGKRSLALHPQALALAEKLASSPSKSERWIGSDAARELRSGQVLARLVLTRLGRKAAPRRTARG